MIRVTRSMSRSSGEAVWSDENLNLDKGTKKGLVRRSLSRMDSSMEAGRGVEVDNAKESGASGEPSALFVLCLVGAAVLVMGLTMACLPPLSTVESQLHGERFIWRPSTAEHFRTDSNIMRAYKTMHQWRLLLGMSVVYITLQTFCVPGSGTTLNVLAGSLLHDVMPRGELLVALPWCVFCTTVGAILTYLISYSTAREYILRRFPDRIEWLQQAAGNKNSFFFLLSLRLSPVMPAWLLNIVAPMTPLPAAHFVLATLVGSFPASLVAVKTGATLSNIQTGDNILKANWPNFVGLMCLALLSALPAMNARSVAKS